jgi:hypothetical protein
MRFKNISLVVVVCALVWPMPSLGQEQTSTADTEARILTLDEAVTLALQHNRLVKNSVLEAQKYDFPVRTGRSRRKPQFQFAMLGGELLHSFDFTFQRGVFGTYPSVGPIPVTNAKVRTPAVFTTYWTGNMDQPIIQQYKVRLFARVSPIQAATSPLEAVL